MKSITASAILLSLVIVGYLTSTTEAAAHLSPYAYEEETPEAVVYTRKRFSWRLPSFSKFKVGIHGGKSRWLD